VIVVWVLVGLAGFGICGFVLFWIGLGHRAKVIRRDEEHYRHVRMVRAPVDWAEQGWFGD
jgi:hypothetical protein